VWRQFTVQERRQINDSMIAGHQNEYISNKTLTIMVKISSTAQGYLCEQRTVPLDD
jgi:hypothetical protein